MIEVQAVGITTPILSSIPDSEGIIAYCARVSNPSNQNNFETANKLLEYCVKHNHWSVFETVNVVLEIKAPRDIARQILRHRSFSFQEFSQRYAEANDFILREARMQDTKNRQNSIPTTDFTLQDMWTIKQNKLLEQVQKTYQWALDNGIAKECARVVLPEGLTMSTMYMNGTVRSWMHYCDLRCDNGTQLEHQIVAEKAREVLTQLLPSVFKEENNG